MTNDPTAVLTDERGYQRMLFRVVLIVMLGITNFSIGSLSLAYEPMERLRSLAFPLLPFLAFAAFFAGPISRLSRIGVWTSGVVCIFCTFLILMTLHSWMRDPELILVQSLQVGDTGVSLYQSHFGISDFVPDVVMVKMERSICLVLKDSRTVLKACSPVTPGRRSLEKLSGNRVRVRFHWQCNNKDIDEIIPIDWSKPYYREYN